MNILENQPRRIHLLNKIIIKQSVLFYAEAWKHRNEVLHHPETYRSYVIEWYNKVVESIENDNRPEMRKYLQAQKLEVENCDSAYIRHWILSTNEMRKKTKVEVINDIRQYFVIQN